MAKGRRRRGKPQAQQQRPRGAGGSDSGSSSGGGGDFDGVDAMASSGSDIDSSEAFDSADEARYGSVLNAIAERRKASSSGAGGSSQNKKSAQDSDVESDDESDDESDGPGGVDDMIRMLGGAVSSSSSEAEDAASAREQVPKADASSTRRARDDSHSSDSMSGSGASSASASSGSDDQSGGSESSSDGGDSQSNGSDDSWLEADDFNTQQNEDDDEAYDRMMSAVSSLQSGGHGRQASQRRGAKRVFDAIAPPLEEDAFNVPGLSKRSSGVSFKAVASNLAEDEEFDDMREQLKSLTKRQRTAAPLPEVVSARLDRKAGYTASSEAVTTWQRFVKEMRGTDSLQFPLHEPKHGVTTASLAANFTAGDRDQQDGSATGELEAGVYSMLGDAQLSNAQEQKKTEALNALPDVEVTEEEVRRRMGELAKMRHLALRAEEKARRRKKIKSKSYRRIQRKEREKNRLTAEELAELDPAAAAEAREKEELKRLRERMTLRHSTSTSKFSKAAKQHKLTSTDSGTKEAVQAQIRLKDSLRQKMDHMDSDTSSSSLGGDTSSDDDGTAPADAPQKGLFGLAFMKRAEAKAQATEPEDAAAASTHAAMLQSTVRADALMGAAADPAGKKKASTLQEESTVAVADDENPWLAETTEQAVSSKRPSKQLVKSARRRRAEETHRDAKPATAAEDTPSRTPDSIEQDSDKVPGNGSIRRGSEKPKSARFDLAEADVESQALITEAFATDDVESEFAEEKARIQRELEAELLGADPRAKEIADATLPGWGSWGGNGAAPPRHRQRAASKIALEARGAARSKARALTQPRKQNVIVQDSRVKALSKYLLEEVPKPFRSRDQYERTLAAPVGTEWQTNRAHDKRTKPKVSVKPGVAIPAMNLGDAREAITHGQELNSKAKRRRANDRSRKQAMKVIHRRNQD